jgi:predicted permease
MRLSILTDVASQTIRYGWRGLWTSPALSVLTIVLLSLGIGFNGAVVMVLDRMLFRPPPGVEHPDDVKRLYQRFTVALTREVRHRDVFSYVELEAMAANVAPTTIVAGHALLKMPIVGANGPAEARVTVIVRDYFGALGVRAARGRLFTPDEWGRSGPQHVVVISDRLWERQYDRADSAIGRTISINAKPFTIIGVAGRDFSGVGLEESDYWIPFNAMDHGGASRPFDTPIDLRLRVLVRTPNETARVAATDALNRAVLGVDVIHDAKAAINQASVSEVIDPQRGKTTVKIAWRLAAAAALVLVIACSNVAGLLLVRASRRRSEIAVRFALGISRAQLAAQLLTEGLLLAGIAGVAAVIAGAWGFLALSNALLPGVTWDLASIAWRGAALIALLVCLTGCGVGILPALYLRDPDLANALRGMGDATRGASRFRAVLLVAQTGLSVVLLAGAGLFVRSLVAVERVGFGYSAEEVLFAWIPRGMQFAEDDPRFGEKVQEAVRRVSALPGVTRTATTVSLPIGGVMFRRLFLPGYDSVPPTPGLQRFYAAVSPGFFDIMGARVLAGRDFTPNDRAGAEHVVIVNATMATQYWPGRSAIGECIIAGKRGEPCRRVVGIVSDTRSLEIFERTPLRWYVPIDQDAREGWQPHVLVVQAVPSQLDGVTASVRQLLAGETGGGLHWEFTTLSALVEPYFRPWRLSATLVALLGIVALIVAGIGTYATISYSVTQRRHELSVRRVLGANDASILRLVLTSTLVPVAIGGALGTGVVLALGPTMKSMLYGVAFYDPGILAGAFGVLTLAAALACCVPALRATRVQPTVALRTT